MMTDKDITLCGHGWGKPSLKNLNAYASERYSQKAANGKRKGIVVVRRLKALSEQGRKDFHDTYKTILGRNIYDQDLRSYVYTPYKNGYYYSDCSSSICATFKKIGYNVSLLNTAGIYTSSLFETVPVVIKDGHIQNPEILKVGDCIEFVGDDPARPLQIGHVEAVYEIAGSPGTVKEFQQFLNTYYPDTVKKCCGKLLDVDGVYGSKTRSGALGVWKYMANKYYKAKLTIGNDNFYSTCKAAAVSMTESECNKHATLKAILIGILAGRGYYSGRFSYNNPISDEVKSGVKAVSGSSSVSSELWYRLFN